MATGRGSLERVGGEYQGSVSYLPLRCWDLGGRGRCEAAAVGQPWGTGGMKPQEGQTGIMWLTVTVLISLGQSQLCPYPSVVINNALFYSKRTMVWMLAYWSPSLCLRGPGRRVRSRVGKQPALGQISLF